MVHPAPFLPQAACWLTHQHFPRRVAVGFSGGADSTALLLAMHSMGYQVIAWHVDHGWHVDSARQAAILREKVGAWGIEFHAAGVRAPLAGNREAGARKARYAQFVTWAIEQNVSVLCLAHHDNDQAETVCMRMLQGAGVAGCAGIKREREFHGLRLVRPLLHVPKSSLRNALRQTSVAWLEDASNRDTTLMRNHIRHRLFPCMRQHGVNPVKLYNRWQVQALHLATRLDEEAGCLEIQHRQGMASVRWNAWCELRKSVRAYVLQRMMATVFGEGRVLGRRHIELAEHWRHTGGHGGIDLCRCRLSHNGKNLHLSTAEVRLQA